MGIFLIRKKELCSGSELFCPPPAGGRFAASSKNIRMPVIRTNYYVGQ